VLFCSLHIASFQLTEEVEVLYDRLEQTVLWSTCSLIVQLQLAYLFEAERFG